MLPPLLSVDFPAFQAFLSIMVPPTTCGGRWWSPADLSAREERFSNVAATAQCKNQFLNGCIGSRQLVSRYARSILDQFSDKAFLEAQRERLKVHAGLSFNEIDSFAAISTDEPVMDSLVRKAKLLAWTLRQLRKS